MSAARACLVIDARPVVRIGIRRLIEPNYEVEELGDGRGAVELLTSVGNFDVAIVNAGGLTHTSVSLRDALAGIQRPFIEVHLSDPSQREPFRHINFLVDLAEASFVGQGARGYHLALELIARDFGGDHDRG